MQCTLPDGTIVHADFHFSLPRSFFPMRHSFGYPPSCPIPVTAYEETLLNLIGASSRFSGTPYSLDDLYIDEVFHMKSQTPIAAGHEFVALTIVNYNNAAQRFRIKLERFPEPRRSVSDLPPEARTRFEASLDDHQRKQLAKSRPKLSSIRNMFRASRTYEMPTLVRVSALEIPSNNDHALRYLKFHNRCLPMLQAIGVASAISKNCAVYSPFRNQSFFFTDSIFRCFERIAADNVSAGTVPIPNSVHLRRADCEAVQVRSKGRSGKDCASLFLVNIYKFQESAFENTIWPVWEAHHREMDNEVAARLEMMSEPITH